jgi:hypothetical protein
MSIELSPKTKKIVNYVLGGSQILSAVLLLNFGFLPPNVAAWIFVIATIIKEILIRVADLLDDGELNNSVNTVKISAENKKV